MTGITPQTRSPETGRFAPKGNAEDLTTLSFKVGASEALRLKQMASEHQVTLSALLRLMTNQFLSGDTELLDLPPTPAALRAQDLWEPEPPATRPVKVEPPPPPEPPPVDPMLEMLKAQQEAMAATQLELTRALAQIAQTTRTELSPVQAVNLPPVEVAVEPAGPRKLSEKVAAILQALRHLSESECEPFEVRATKARVYVRAKCPRKLRERLTELLGWKPTEKELWCQYSKCALPDKALARPVLLGKALPTAKKPALPAKPPALPAAEVEWVE